jgi:nitrous oxidase accessory protein NosD
MQLLAWLSAQFPAQIFKNTVDGRSERHLHRRGIRISNDGLWSEVLQAIKLTMKRRSLVRYSSHYAVVMATAVVL